MWPNEDIHCATTSCVLGIPRARRAITPTSTWRTTGVDSYSQRDGHRRQPAHYGCQGVKPKAYGGRCSHQQQPRPARPSPKRVDNAHGLRGAHRGKPGAGPPCVRKTRHPPRGSPRFPYAQNRREAGTRSKAGTDIGASASMR